MIILDTNVVSEAFKPDPAPVVLEWLDRQQRDSLGFTAVSLAEIYRGIALLPEGKRKTRLHAETDAFLDDLFGSRIFAFDRESALKSAELIAKASRAGRSIGFADGQIAAIASLRDCSVASRDTSPFQAAGLNVINPWADR